MNCTEFLDQLEEIASRGPDILLPPELQEHHLGCDDCQEQLRELQKAWLMLPTALEESQVSSELEARVMKAINASPKAVSMRLGSSTFWKYALAASVLFALIGGTLFSPAWLGSEDRDVERIKELARQMDKLEQLEGAFAAPELRYVSLRSVGPRHPVQGYLVYDLVALEAHFFGFQLPNAGADHYRIWLVDGDGRELASARIAVDSQQLGAAIVRLPNDVSSIQEVIVTLESTSNPNSPSDRMQMRTPTDI